MVLTMVLIMVLTMLLTMVLMMLTMVLMMMTVTDEGKNAITTNIMALLRLTTTIA